MPKLISVDEARAYALERFPSPVVRKPIEEVLDKCPAADVQDIVRCKECRKRGGYGCPMCDCEQLWDEDDGWVDAFRDRTEDEGFCHKGVKMDGGEEK